MNSLPAISEYDVLAELYLSGGMRVANAPYNSRELEKSLDDFLRDEFCTGDTSQAPENGLTPRFPQQPSLPPVVQADHGDVQQVMAYVESLIRQQ